jgi:predicted NAD/FAD-binding protein
MLNFPVRFFVEFFSNHGFLSVDERPTWRVIRGGSREYVKRLTAAFAGRIRLHTPVESLQRHAHKVSLRLKNGSIEEFDHVVIACHSDQALALLSDPSPAERDILGAIAYQANEALLHTDIRLMPRRPLAWAAWNYHLPVEPCERVTVTYNMNILQSLDAPAHGRARPQPAETPAVFLLTLNRSADVDPRTVLGSYVYHHPVYTAAAVAAQRRRPEINGARRTYYCGAYWSYGFHEDGVNSALACVEEFRRRETHAQPHLQRVG